MTLHVMPTGTINSDTEALPTQTSAGGGGGTITTQDEGVTLSTAVDTINFVGAGVTASGAGNVTTVTIPSSGTLQSQLFTSNGTFTAPAGVSGVWISGVGGGGGGSSTIVAAQGGGGGGSGEMVNNFFLPVTALSNYAVVIGIAGTGAAAGQVTAQAGVDGGDTTFNATYILKGGKGGVTTGSSGAGGGANGRVSGAGTGSIGTAESPIHFGGSSGGAGGNGIAVNGFAAGGGGGNSGGAGGAAGGSQGGGGGGASSEWGAGATGGAGGTIGNNASATSYGAGGGGGGAKATTTIGGGNGCAGVLLVAWVG